MAMAMTMGGMGERLKRLKPQFPPAAIALQGQIDFGMRVASAARVVRLAPHAGGCVFADEARVWLPQDGQF